MDTGKVVELSDEAININKSLNGILRTVFTITILYNYVH